MLIGVKIMNKVIGLGMPVRQETDYLAGAPDTKGTEAII